MSEYSYNQIKKMEQEATRRAKEMARLSRPAKKETEEAKAEPVKKKRKNSLGFLNALDIKKLIGENSEQALLLLLIIILSNDDNCDEFLIYALIYIML